MNFETRGRVECGSLSQFLVDNLGAILGDWESFARTLHGGRALRSAHFREDGERMLRSIAADMQAARTPAERRANSRGEGAQLPAGESSASHLHGSRRLLEGFSLPEVIAEFRALRASVIRLWSACVPDADDVALLEVSRFNEAIDQSLAEAVARYIDKVDQGRDMLLAVLGHDLRNPLSAVMMSGEAIEHSASDPRLLASAQRIKQSSRRIEAIVNNLIDVTHVRLGEGLKLYPTHCNIAEVCAGVIGELQTVNPTRVIDLRVEGDATARADPTRIGQLASNLIGNAVQHGSPDAPIVVAIRGAECLELAVENAGSAIPERSFDGLFDPFVRGGSLPYDGRSMGLGLYVVREIARAHGGRVAVQSDPLRTRFTVTLPRDRAP